ncbi:hypothetical protein E4T56_gene5662 [Termitomyces sp. T112]|nr:hypothetical protein E4T56_gene5662 [Termitomyces sp. T112]
MAPTPANSNASSANPDNSIANSDIFSGDLITSSSSKPLGPSNILPDPEIPNNYGADCIPISSHQSIPWL